MGKQSKFVTDRDGKYIVSFIVGAVFSVFAHILFALLMSIAGSCLIPLYITASVYAVYALIFGPLSYTKTEAIISPSFMQLLAAGIISFAVYKTGLLGGKYCAVVAVTALGSAIISIIAAFIKKKIDQKKKCVAKEEDRHL